MSIPFLHKFLLSSEEDLNFRGYKDLVLFLEKRIQNETKYLKLIKLICVFTFLWTPIPFFCFFPGMMWQDLDIEKIAACLGSTVWVVLLWATNSSDKLKNYTLVLTALKQRLKSIGPNDKIPENEFQALAIEIFKSYNVI